MSLLEPPTLPAKGDIRLIFEEQADVERAADWLEAITGGRVALGASCQGRKGGVTGRPPCRCWIVRGFVKLPEESDV